MPILKSDKKLVQIYGDFKQTVNRAAKVDAYPIPKIEDLFAKLVGGKLISKLDLSQARDENNYQAATRQLSGHSEIDLPPQNV